MDKFLKEFTHNDERKWCKIIFNEQGIEYQSKNHTGKTYKGRNIYHCFFPYGSITKLELDKGMRLLGIHFCVNTEQEVVYFNAKDYIKDRELSKAIKLAQKQIQTSHYEEVVFYNQIIVEDKFANETQHIMLCEKCGHVFRYTNDDMKNYFDMYDEKRKEISKLQTDAVVEAIIGTRLLSQMATYRAEDKIEKLESITPFDACPKCKSTKTKRITEQEFKEIQDNQNISTATAVVSSADELKKFKELLDCGAITQEEFEAKKKQLLGL